MPVRLLFFFVVTGFTYAWKPAGGALGGTGLGGTNVGKGSAGWADGLKNSVVFSWGFLEMIWWFWVSGFEFVRLGGNGRSASGEWSLGRTCANVYHVLDLCYAKG